MLRKKKSGSASSGSFGTASGLQVLAEAEFAKAKALADQARAEIDPQRRSALIEQARQAALTAQTYSTRVKQLVE